MFSTSDTDIAYWKIEIFTEDRGKTAFASHQGMFRFVILPFGLSKAPGTFHRSIYVILYPSNGSLPYIFRLQCGFFQNAEERISQMQIVL